MNMRNPTLAAIQTLVAIALGIAVSVALQNVDRRITTVLLAIFFSLFFFSLFGIARGLIVSRLFRGRRRRGRGNGGDWTGVREPRRPYPPGPPPRPAVLDPPIEGHP